MAMFEKLSHLLAAEKGVKTRAENVITDLYQKLQKSDLVLGLLRTFAPAKEDGPQHPAEKKIVSLKVMDALERIAESTRIVANITALKDATNMTARGDIVIDGETLLAGVPVTHLLFLEKRMATAIDIIKAFPVLSQDASWSKNEALSLYETEPVKSFSTKKVESWITVVQPTKEHPAQTQKMTVDEIVGTWSAITFSGALPADRKQQMLARAEKMLTAVKIARDRANQVPVVEFASGKLFDYVFGL